MNKDEQISEHLKEAIDTYVEDLKVKTGFYEAIEELKENDN